MTELPQEYVALEVKLEKIKILYETFLRLSRNFTHNDYDASVAETVKDAYGKFNDLVIKPTQQQLAGGNQSGNPGNVSYGGNQQQQQAEIVTPPTFAHALARASSQGALTLGTEEPLGAALTKYSAAQDKLGNARLKMETEVVQKFVQPWTATLHTNIAFALKSKKQVQSTRLALNAAKSTMKSAKPDRLPQAQLDLETAEQELQQALQDSMHKIHLVVNSPEPLRNLADLVGAQLQYFKIGYEALSELAPEIDEMQVTQEALFRSK